MTKLNVNTPHVYPNQYQIIFTDEINPILGLMKETKGNKILIVNDLNIEKYYPNLLQSQIKDKNKTYEIHKHTIGIGEEIKTIQTVENILEKLFVNKFTKNDLIISMGGGIVNDVTGYTASIYKRGMIWTSVPTTLLAMVDASIGGKTGVNNSFGKNMRGSMYNPSIVIINTNYLNTLPQIRLTEGLVELAKHFILFDKNNFIRLNKIIDNTLNSISLTTLEMEEHKQKFKSNLIKDPEFKQIIIESMKIKKDVVEKDARENNLRKALNLGHTIGHAIEILDPNIKHGIAVAKGTIAELTYGMEKGIVNKDDLSHIKNFYSKIDIDYSIKKDYDLKTLIKYMTNDKKRTLKNLIPIVLINGIGDIYKYNGSVVYNLGEDEMLDFLENYC